MSILSCPLPYPPHLLLYSYVTPPCQFLSLFTQFHVKGMLYNHISTTILKVKIIDNINPLFNSLPRFPLLHRKRVQRPDLPAKKKLNKETKTERGGGESYVPYICTRYHMLDPTDTQQHNTLKPQTSNSKNQKRYTCTLAAQNTKEQEEQYKHPTTSASLHCLIKGWS